MEVLETIFWEEDVKAILAIPTGTGYNDESAWHAGEKGLFSERSAYHVYVEEEKRRSQRGIVRPSRQNAEYEVN